MKGRETFITLLALVAIGLTSFFAYRYERKPEPHSCPFCDRMIHQGTAYRLLVGNQTQTACCPRCGMHYVAHHPSAVQQAWATDLDTGVSIPAASAYYEDGGDVEYCTSRRESVQRGPDSVSVRGYDRCLPSLVAFKTQAEAEIYQKQHGGRVLTYAQALESVREQ